LFYFRTIAFSILIFLLCESIAISAVTWSFLESSISSFQFIKISSDNRARDTVVSLAKASEIRMNYKGWFELQKSFHRLYSITSQDPDGFKVEEIVLLDAQGVVLANSDKNEISIPYNDRKPDPKYNNALYQKALRMRKWQYPEPIVLPEQKKNSSISINWLDGKWNEWMVLFFPEAKDEKGLVSVAVYHETKLDVIGSLHLIYSRGNFSLFLAKQKEIYFWMIRTYVLVAFAISLALIVVFTIVSIFNKKNSTWKQKKIPANEESPPLLEKIVVQDENANNKLTPTDSNIETLTSSIQEEKQESQIYENSETVKTMPIYIPTAYQTQGDKNLANIEGEIEKNLNTSLNGTLTNQGSISNSSDSKRKIVDAIYLGNHGS
jgi:hypothetical protein